MAGLNFNSAKASSRIPTIEEIPLSLAYKLDDKYYVPVQGVENKFIVVERGGSSWGSPGFFPMEVRGRCSISTNSRVVSLNRVTRFRLKLVNDAPPFIPYFDHTKPDRAILKNLDIPDYHYPTYLLRGKDFLILPLRPEGDVGIWLYHESRFTTQEVHRWRISPVEFDGYLWFPSLSLVNISLVDNVQRIESDKGIKHPYRYNQYHPASFRTIGVTDIYDDENPVGYNRRVDKERREKSWAKTAGTQFRNR